LQVFKDYISLVTIVIENMKENLQASSINSSPYVGSVGEIISYIEHPIISINNICIKYLGIQEQPATEQHVAMGDVYIFEVSTDNGPKHKINWSTGTGDLPGPMYFKTSDSCYELQINIIEVTRWGQILNNLLEGKRGLLKNIQGKLILNRKSEHNCPEWAKE